MALANRSLEANPWAHHGVATNSPACDDFGALAAVQKQKAFYHEEHEGHEVISSHSHKSGRAGSQTQQSRNQGLVKTTVAFCPPNPKELEIAALTAALLASFATTFKSHSGSGVW